MNGRRVKKIRKSAVKWHAQLLRSYPKMPFKYAYRKLKKAYHEYKKLTKKEKQTWQRKNLPELT